jgi:GTPase SAR1 family protein
MNKPEHPILPKGLRVEHLIMYPAWDIAYKRAIAFAQLSPNGAVALIVGPGGAGKSSMCEALGQEVYGDPSTWAPGQMPYVRVTADNPDRSFFTSKNMMVSLLSAVMDPFSVDSAMIEDWAIDAGLKSDLRWAITRLGRSRNSEADLRRAFSSIARAVGLKLILVDEANLMCLTQANRVPTDYLESLRLLCQSSGCRAILFGTIDLLGLVDYSAQLNRRGPRIHLDRMKLETRQEKLEFVSFLSCLEGEFKLTPGLLVEHAEDMSEFSYGIPGEIVGLLQRADEERAAQGDKMITWEHIETRAPLPDVLHRMRQEADIIALVMAGTDQGKSKVPRARGVRRPRRRPTRYPTSDAGE